MCRSCHNRSVEISVEPRNLRRTLDVYLLLFSDVNYQPYFKSKRLKWHLFKKNILLVITLNEDDQLKKAVNKHRKFDETFEIRR